MKLLSINRFRTPFLKSVLMNYSELIESTWIRLLGLTFANNFSWNPYIESIANLLPWMLDLYFGWGTFFRLKVYFISIRLPINHVLSIAATFGWSLCCIVYIFLTEFWNVYLTLLVLIFVWIFNRFPIADMWLHCLCSISISMDIFLMIWKN